MAEKIDSKNIIKWGICIAITILCFLIPIDEVFTAQCRTFVAVTVFCILLLAFDLLDSLLIGLLLPTLWVLTGCATFAQAMSGWTGSYPLMFVSAFIMATALERIGLLSRIGYKIIVLCGGSFTKVIFGLFFACLIANVMTFGMGLYLACALGLALMKALDVKPTSPEAACIVLAVLMGAVQSGSYIYSPVSYVMLVGAASAADPNFSLSWIELALHQAPVFLFSVAFLWGYLKLYNRKHKSEISVDEQMTFFKDKLTEMGKMKSDEKKALVVLLAMLAYMLYAPSKNWDIAYGFFAATAVLYLPFINVANNEDIRVAMKNYTPIIFLVLAFLSIGTVGTACGFGALIVAKLVPVMGEFGYVGSIFATLGVGTVANFILTPGAMIMLLIGPIVQFCMELGYNYLPHIYSIYLTEHAIFHPYEWPSYLTIFAFGLINMSNYVKLCCQKTIVYLIFVCLIMVPFWLFIV